jgi:hypothetical protein
MLTTTETIDQPGADAPRIRGDTLVCVGCERLTDAPLCDDCADELLPDPHAGHELVKARVWRAGGEEVGFLACLDCAVLLRPLALCGARTAKGTRCRALIRSDLGERRCRQHGAGGC